MLYNTVLSLLGFSGACQNKEWDQCGGQSFSGPTCCPAGDSCVVNNQYYSQCLPSKQCMNAQWAQCGGTDPKTQQPWPANKTCCPENFVCEKQNPYYSQCNPDTSNKTCAQGYEQCGGVDADQKPWGSEPGEKTCCLAGYTCSKDNEYYSGCKPEPFCANADYGQCGGVDQKQQPWDTDHGHDTCCPCGFSCSKQSQYYSQCMPNATKAPAPGCGK